MWCTKCFDILNCLGVGYGQSCDKNCIKTRSRVCNKQKLRVCVEECRHSTPNKNAGIPTPNK